jgi:protein-disulfide isomerase
MTPCMRARCAVVLAAALAAFAGACGGDGAQGRADAGDFATPSGAAQRGAPGAANRAPRRSTLRVDPNIGYSLGRADAPVTVHEFSDYGCAQCATFKVTTFSEIEREFIDTGRVRWIFVPFVVGMFRHAEEAARAGECAADQDRFWAMTTQLYAGQRDWRRGRQPFEHFARYAGAIGLDPARFATCYERNDGAARTLANNRTAQVLSVRGTPTFIINGRFIEGALPVERFRQLITQAESDAAAEAGEAETAADSSAHVESAAEPDTAAAGG